MITIYPGNSGFITLNGFAQNLPGLPPSFVNDGVLAATLYDPCSNPVVGFIGIPGVYRSGSEGVYDFSFNEFEPETSGGLPNYTLKITGTAGGASYEADVPTIVTDKVTGAET